MNKILVIDDDIAICELIKINLELAGYTCHYETNPIKGFAILAQEDFDLLILDVMMGEVDGYSVALKIRQQENELKNLPIIMLTALGELQDKIKGFSTGIDDYLTKPFEIEELKARVLALLNRAGKTPASMRTKELLTIGEIVLLPDTYSVEFAGKKVKFTPIEYEIINTLVQNNSQMVSSKDLLKDIWGYNEDESIDTIRVHIRHIRCKIAKVTDKDYIKTIYGGGYKLNPNGEN